MAFAGLGPTQVSTGKFVPRVELDLQMSKAVSSHRVLTMREVLFWGSALVILFIRELLYIKDWPYP